VELLPFVLPNNFTLLLLAAVVAVGMWATRSVVQASRLRDARAPSAQSDAVADDPEQEGKGTVVAKVSLSETQSCWQLISNRATLLPYARGL
jgi:hypothetical protein